MSYTASNFFLFWIQSIKGEINVRFDDEQINSLSSVRLVIAKDLLPLEARENTLKKVSEVISRFSKEGMPLLDPEEDMKVLFY